MESGTWLSIRVVCRVLTVIYEYIQNIYTIYTYIIGKTYFRHGIHEHPPWDSSAMGYMETAMGYIDAAMGYIVTVM